MNAPLLLQYAICPCTNPIAGYTIPAEIIIRNGQSITISPAKTFAPVKAQPPSIKLNWNVIPGKTILKYILTIRECDGATAKQSVAKCPETFADAAVSVDVTASSSPSLRPLEYGMEVKSSDTNGKSTVIELSNTLSTYICSHLKMGNVYTFTIQMVFSDITNDIYRFVSASTPTFMHTSNTIGINWSVPTVPTGLAVTYVSTNSKLRETTFCASWLHGLLNEVLRLPPLSGHKVPTKEFSPSPSDAMTSSPVRSKLIQLSSDKIITNRPSILNYTLTITTLTNDVKQTTHYTTEKPSFDKVICKVGSQYILSVYSTNLIGNSPPEILAINWTVPNPPINITLTNSENLKDTVISWEPGPMIPNQQYITSYQITITDLDTNDCIKLTAYVPSTSIPFAAESEHTYEISIVAVNLVGSSNKSIPYTILWRPPNVDKYLILEEPHGISKLLRLPSLSGHKVPTKEFNDFIRLSSPEISISNREISWLSNKSTLTEYSIFVSTVVNGRTVRTTYTSTTTSLPFTPTLGNTYSIYVTANNFVSPTLKSIWITLSAPTAVAISDSGVITWNPGRVVSNVPPLISYNVNIADKIIATNITTNLPQIAGLLFPTYSFVPVEGHSYSVRIFAVNGAGTSPLSVAAIL
jgi:hypothetical protein